MTRSNYAILVSTINWLLIRNIDVTLFSIPPFVLILTRLELLVGFARNIHPRRSSVITGYVATRWYRAPELLLGYLHPINQPINQSFNQSNHSFIL